MLSELVPIFGALIPIFLLPCLFPLSYYFSKATTESSVRIGVAQIAECRSLRRLQWVYRKGLNDFPAHQKGTYSSIEKVSTAVCSDSKYFEARKRYASDRLTHNSSIGDWQQEHPVNRKNCCPTNSISYSLQVCHPFQSDSACCQMWRKSVKTRYCHR